MLVMMLFMLALATVFCSTLIYFAEARAAALRSCCIALLPICDFFRCQFPCRCRARPSAFHLSDGRTLPPRTRAERGVPPDHRLSDGPLQQHPPGARTDGRS